jgi:hypothetical protein
MQAVLLAAVNSGNRKTWQILLPTFRFGSNKFSNTISFLQHLIQNKILFHLEQQLTASSDAIRRLML